MKVPARHVYDCWPDKDLLGCGPPLPEEDVRDYLDRIHDESGSPAFEDVLATIAEADDIQTVCRDLAQDIRGIAAVVAKAAQTEPTIYVIVENIPTLDEHGNEHVYECICPQHGYFLDAAQVEQRVGELNAQWLADPDVDWDEDQPRFGYHPVQPQ